MKSDLFWTKFDHHLNVSNLYHDWNRKRKAIFIFEDTRKLRKLTEILTVFQYRISLRSNCPFFAKNIVSESQILDSNEKLTFPD